MERKQGFLFRCVDVVMEAFAMTAPVLREARQMRDSRHPGSGQHAEQLAEYSFCRTSTRKVKRLLPRDFGATTMRARNAVAAA